MGGGPKNVFWRPVSQCECRLKQSAGANNTSDVKQHTHTHTQRVEGFTFGGAGTCRTLNGGACCINVQGADPAVSIRRPPTCTETKPKTEPRTRGGVGAEINDGLGSLCTRVCVQILTVITSVLVHVSVEGCLRCAY